MLDLVKITSNWLKSMDNAKEENSLNQIVDGVKEKIVESSEKALRLAVAAATASVTKEGTESPSLEEIKKYKDKVKIHEH